MCLKKSLMHGSTLNNHLLKFLRKLMMFLENEGPFKETQQLVALLNVNN